MREFFHVCDCCGVTTEAGVGRPESWSKISFEGKTVKLGSFDGDIEWELCKTCTARIHKALKLKEKERWQCQIKGCTEAARSHYDYPENRPMYTCVEPGKPEKE